MYNSLKMLWRILRGFLKINGELKHISIDVLKKELYSSWQSSYLHHTSGAITEIWEVMKTIMTVVLLQHKLMQNYSQTLSVAVLRLNCAGLYGFVLFCEYDINICIFTLNLFLLLA